MPLGPAQDQYTVNVASTITPVKLAGFPGPFQVINLNTSATVWLADSSNVSDGNGVPLNPGSSLTWTGSQFTNELWGILGTDAQTATQSSVDIIISANVLGWQQNPVATAIAILNSGLILVDQPAILASVVGQSAATRNFPTTGTYAVNNYQSLIVRYRVGGGAHTVQLSIRWYADSAAGQLIGMDQYNWVAADTNPMNTNIPIRGAYMNATLNLAPAAVGNDDLVFVASNRLHNHWSADMANGTRVLFSGGGNVGAGAQVQFVPNVARYDGPATITLNGSSAGVPLPALVEGRDLVNASDFFATEDAGAVFIGAGRVLATYKCVIPRNSWSILIFNGGGAIGSFTINVVAAPEGT